MDSVEEVLQQLKAKAQPDQLEGMAKFGLTGRKRLGVRVPEMRKIAKLIEPNHQLALALWQTGIAEAMMVASMIDVPEKVTADQMDNWAQDLQAWDVCDQVCMNLFDRTPLAWQKVRQWAEREEEFVKRAAFALIACLAWHNKEAADEAFIELLPLIKAGATDERNYVKKGVSWALRQIGKRNPQLNEVALQTAAELQEMDSKPAKWIGRDAVRDLTSETTQRRLSKQKEQGK